MTDRVTVAAHAKVNLLLRVLAREESGYHALETVFALLELHDDIVVERTVTGISIEVEGADTGPPEENLAVRAAHMVLQATGMPFGVHIRLRKQIPVRAGLGGGSSDAAATLHAVNALASGAVPRHELLQFAARLGSDVPFFFSGAPLAVGWGRGERLFRLVPPPPAPVLLAVPDFGVGTKEAYELLARTRTVQPQRGSVVLEAEAFGTWGGIGRLGGNDFETPIFAKYPALRELFERLALTRPLVVRMSGSGSALLAIYKTPQDRDAAALEIGTGRARLIPTTTRRDPAPAVERWP